MQRYRGACFRRTGTLPLSSLARMEPLAGVHFWQTPCQDPPLHLPQVLYTAFQMFEGPNLQRSECVLAQLLGVKLSVPEIL